jgi:serine/threonine protein kinase
VGPDFLVMEYVEGQPLKGPLPVEKAVEYARQILDALDAAHRMGIVHRDLKPDNILVTKNGVKLLDFGLAKAERAKAISASEDTVTQTITREGTILGTLQYMAPEQLQGKGADARGDLFSFGCVLYEMVTGKRAFEGASAPSVIAAVLEREPAPLEVSPPLAMDSRCGTAVGCIRRLGGSASPPTGRCRSSAPAGYQSTRRGPVRRFGLHCWWECLIDRWQDGSICRRHQRENRAVGAGSRRNHRPSSAGNRGRGRPLLVSGQQIDCVLGGRQAAADRVGGRAARDDL